MSEQPPPPNAAQAPQYQGQNQQYQQPYGVNPYAQPMGPRTNGLAIAALILGLTTGLGGIIAGHLALSQIKRTGEAGHGLALAGLIIGYVYTGFTVLYIIGMVVLFAVTFSMGSSTLVT